MNNTTVQRVKMHDGRKVILRSKQLEDGRFEGAFDIDDVPEGITLTITTTFDMDGYCQADKDFSIIEWDLDGELN